MSMQSEAVLAAALSVMSFAAGAAGTSGNAVRGQSLYESRCTACHSVDRNRVGPAHAGVFGRKAGSVEGYAYSKALQSTKIVWREPTLDRWLRNPEATVPGQKMGYSVTEPQDRADLIAYLKTLPRP
jgi:cytochrome c